MAAAAANRSSQPGPTSTTMPLSDAHFSLGINPLYNSRTSQAKRLISCSYLWH